MKIVAIVQTRLASARLPAKILLDLGGKTALERCIRRAQRIDRVAEVVIATSTAPHDDVIERMAARLGVRSVRGSLLDVLSRFVDGARATNADAIVRLTSDCPLLDPSRSSEVVNAFVTGGVACDYASNVLTRRLPRGLDTEVVSRAALERADAEAVDPAQREHVTLPIVANRSRYRCLDVSFAGPDLSHHRWTLDTLDDYRFLYWVYEALGEAAADASMDDIVALLARRPELRAMNEHVEQKRG